MSANTAKIIANGEPQTIELPCSMAKFLEQHGWRTTQVVVEINGRVIPRGEVGAVALSDGDQIEIIVPVAGG